MRGPRHFYRHSSAEVLEAFFAALRIPMTPHARFRTLKAQVEWAEETARSVTADARHVFSSVMADVGALASDLGAQCLRETLIARRPEFASEFVALKSDYDRGTCVWLHDKRLFDEAVARWFLERLRPTGTWADAYVISKGASLAADDFDIKGALMPIVDQYDAGTPGIAIERYALDDARGERGEVTLLSIFYEGRWNSQPRIEQGQVGAVAARVMHHVAVQIESAAGLMYVVSDSRSRKQRGAIAQAIANVGLGLSGEFVTLQQRQYNLQRLLDPTPFTWDPEHRIESVCVPSLTLQAPSFGETKHRTFSSGKDPEDVRVQAIGKLGSADRRLARVINGDLRVVFAPRPGRSRGRAVTLSFNGPESCAMNLDCSEEDLLRARYFDLWNLTAPARGMPAVAR